MYVNVTFKKVIFQHFIFIFTPILRCISTTRCKPVWLIMQQMFYEGECLRVIWMLLTMKRPLQLLVFQWCSSREQPVEAVQRRQQVQQVAQQRPCHRDRQKEQRVDDLTQHTASR